MVQKKAAATIRTNNGTWAVRSTPGQSNQRRAYSPSRKGVAKLTAPIISSVAGPSFQAWAWVWSAPFALA